MEMLQRVGSNHGQLARVGTVLSIVFAVSFALLAFPPAPASAATGGSLYLSAATMWAMPGIAVNAGDTLTLTASGTFGVAGSDPGKTPAGVGCAVQTSPAGFAAPNLSLWSVVGRIGFGTPFCIGAGSQVTAAAFGQLFVTINDDVFGDNWGGVTISWQIAAAVTLPAAPSNATATATSTSSIVVTWSDNSTNETGFRISDNVTTVTLPAGTQTYAWTGLVAGTYKCSHVQAYNSAGVSAWTSWGCTTTPAAVTIPAAPSNLSATPLSSSSIRVTWSDNSNNETSFAVKRYSWSGSAWVTIASAGAGVTSWTDSGLAPSSDYPYLVCARNSAGENCAANWTRATTPAAAVSGTREQRAVPWATGRVGSTAYEGYCELFVENAFGTSGRYASAISNYNAMNNRGAIHGGNTSVPAGALAFFGATSSNGYFGHVMLSLGNGQFVSTNVGSSGYLVNSGRVGYTTISLVQASSGPYLGWGYADSAWPGR
jgi:hypothetical protein